MFRDLDSPNPSRRIRRLQVGMLLTAMLTGLAHGAPDVGDPAPEFSLPGSDGQTWTLSALRGDWVVVAFFPKAFTGG